MDVYARSGEEGRNTDSGETRRREPSRSAREGKRGREGQREARKRKRRARAAVCVGRSVGRHASG